MKPAFAIDDRVFWTDPNGLDSNTYRVTGMDYTASHGWIYKICRDGWTHLVAFEGELRAS